MTGQADAAETDLAQRPDDWDPVSSHATADPLMVQAEMRAGCPVAWTSRLGDGFWALFRYDDIVRAAIDTSTFSVAGHPRLGEQPSPPLEVDRPEHTLYRRLLQPYFIRQAVSRRETEVRALAQAMLEPVAAAGTVDLAASFTYPYPARVLCRLLRIPDDDWVRLKRWADEFFQAGEERDNDPATKAEANRKLLDYGAELIRDRRARRLDPGEDLLTRLVTAEVDGAPLSDDRIVGIVRLLLTAGHNSTTSSLGNVFLRLAVDHNLQARLRAEPEHIEAAIEEILRFETPVMTTPRYVTRDVVVGSRQLRAGETVALVWASANRDASHFTAPDECRVDRTDNDHLVFGRGIHKCLGVYVALSEIRIAVEEMFAMTDAFELDGEPVRTNWERYGVSRLPMRLTAAAPHETG